MKNPAKLIVIAVFGVFVLGLVLHSAGGLETGSRTFAKGNATPTPKAATSAKPANTAANAAANSAKPSNATANTAMPATPTPEPAATGGKEIAKTFTLAKDSQSEYGEVAFNHENHAFKMYSPDGKSVMGCVQCHHTDQPKSALKPPDVTSERDVTLTLAVYKSSPQKVNDCRACHFQDGNVPDGKTMPAANGKDMTNEIAYHINCNGCHDAAFKARPELKSRPGFATSKDCTICHKKN